MFTRKQSTIQLSPDELLSKMGHFCAYRERCPKEVQAKLKELGASGAVAREVIAVLKADKFFDEQRFARAYASGKFRNNHWGKVRIRLELRMRDISPDFIQEALDIIETDVYETVLLKLLQKKLTQYGTDEKASEKTAASLIRSGYEPELVFKNLNKIR